METLAVKYRPKTFDDVVEQGSIKLILNQQLQSNETKNAYLFCGGAGTGKTTCARIFASEINKGQGNPIEMDAASNSGVDDVRNIIQQAKSKSLDSEYKVFIIDECHAISNIGWQAFLKLIEEPPAKSVFIFCTTNPEKIPKTILSRVQRYDFQRISQKGIVDRLADILYSENLYGYGDNAFYMDALEYIAKIADGGMRDAISMMDKCLAYSTKLTMENVLSALGTVDYLEMMNLTDMIINQNNPAGACAIVESIHNSGKDLKQFISQYINFLVDVNKYFIGVDWSLLSLPKTAELESWLQELNSDEEVHLRLLDKLIQLKADTKYAPTPKYDFEAMIMLMKFE